VTRGSLNYNVLGTYTYHVSVIDSICILHSSNEAEKVKGKTHTNVVCRGGKHVKVCFSTYLFQTKIEVTENGALGSFWYRLRDKTGGLND
jgi:hypothetical protein